VNYNFYAIPYFKRAYYKRKKTEQSMLGFLMRFKL